jgi:hypothetical protein
MLPKFTLRHTNALLMIFIIKILSEMHYEHKLVSLQKTGLSGSENM